MTEVEDELGAASPGRASARGWVQAKQWTMAELLGTARQRVDGGGCGGACRRRRLRSSGRWGESQRGGEATGEWEEREGDVGVGVALVDVSRASAEAGGGWRVAAGAGHALVVLLARGGGRLARASRLGRARWAGGLHLASFSLSLLFSVFLIYLLFL